MGVLVNVKSEPSFVLQREDLDRALRGLKRLAKSMPGELEAPEALARSKTLADALERAYWSPSFDAFGDLVGLNYQVDKAPHDSTDFWPLPILEVLAKAGARGQIRYSADEYECVYELDHDGVGRRASLPLLVVGQQPDRAAPGESVVVQIKAGDSIPAVPLNVSVHCDWMLDEQDSGVTTHVSTEPLRAGELRELTLELGAQARGGLNLMFSAGDAYACWSLAIEPTAEELAKPWTVIDRRSVADRRVMVPKGAIKKTLERLRRFAIRHCERPGAGFLREVAKAESLDAALAAASLELRAVEREQELVFVGDRLPGAERYFIPLLDLLAKPAATHCRMSLALAYAEAPELWREYRVRYGDIRCSVSRRV